MEKYNIVFNKIVDLEIKEKEFFEKFKLISINLNGYKSDDRWNYSYRRIFNNDKDFYRDNLLSVDTVRNNNIILMFKNKEGILEKVKEDAKDRDYLIISEIKGLSVNIEVNILNLLLKSLLKVDNKHPFINDSYYYMKVFKIYDDRCDFVSFVPVFNLKDGEIYINGTIRNMKDVTNNHKKYKDYDKFGLLGDTFVSHFDSDIHDRIFTYKERSRNTRATLTEMVYSSSTSINDDDINYEKFIKSRQYMLWEAIDKLLREYNYIINFDLLKVGVDSYERVDEEDNFKKEGKVLREKFDNIILNQIKGKKFYIKDNVLSDVSFKNKEFIKTYFVKMGMVYDENCDYLINLTLDKDLYKKEDDPYIEHDFKKVIKNFNICNVKKINEKEIVNINEQQLKYMILSLIVEEDLIRGKSDLLKDRLDYEKISFFTYKKKLKLFFNIDLYKDGKIDINVSAPDYSERLKKLGLKCDNHYLKNIVKDFDYKDFIDFSFVINDDFYNIYEYRKSPLKPMIDRECFEFLYQKILCEGKDRKDLIRVFDKNGGGRTMSMKTKEFLNKYCYGHLGIKKYDNIYFAGFKTKALNTSIKKAPNGRYLKGDDGKIMDEFLKDVFSTFKSPNNEYKIRPFIYKYLSDLEKIVRNDRENVEEE